MSEPEPISISSVGRHVGREVRAYETLASTNTLALSLAADPANAGVVVVARSQNAGRGQYGRTWSAPAGSSVLLSAIVFPPPSLRPPAILTAWAAVAVCDVVDALAPLAPRLCGGPGEGGEGGRNPSRNIEDARGFAAPPHPNPLPPQSRGERGRIDAFTDWQKPGSYEPGLATIKWPNDVLVAGKKIAGILIEQRTTNGSLAAVVGIGLNVRQSAADFAELPDATSLAIALGQDFDAESVCRSLIERLDDDYGRLLAGDFSTLGDSWQQRLGLVGKLVVVECIDRVLEGRLLEVGVAAVVLQVDGDLVHLPPESIRHLRTT